MMRRLPADDSRIELPQGDKLLWVRGLFNKDGLRPGFLSVGVGDPRATVIFVALKGIGCEGSRRFASGLGP